MRPVSGTPAPKIGFRSPISWRHGRFHEPKLLPAYPLRFGRCTRCRRSRNRRNTISLDSFIRRFQDAKILPESETAELFERYAAVTSVYPRDSDMVSCHNDLKPENVLFDGDRVWLVDWEAAFLNDRYFDLAIVANFVVTNDTEEEAYLRTYFGEAAGEYRLARFYLMRQTMHMLGAIVFMLFGSGGKPIDPHAKALDFRDFHDGIWTGEISLASNEAKLQYARVHMNQALRNMRTARFQDALRIVADRHPAAWR